MKRVFFVALLSITACAQTPPAPASARIFGEVWSAGSCGARRSPEEIERLGCGGKPVLTTVVVTSTDGAFVRKVQTDARGRYEIEVPPGAYLLNVAASGTRTSGKAQGTVAAGESKELWLHLGSMVK